MKLRSDFRTAVTIMNRRHRESGEERPEPIPFYQYKKVAFVFFLHHGGSGMETGGEQNTVTRHIFSCVLMHIFEIWSGRARTIVAERISEVTLGGAWLDRYGIRPAYLGLGGPLLLGLWVSHFSDHC